MSTTLELLRQLVRQQTTGIGNQVTNLVGPTSKAVAPVSVDVNMAWRVLQLPGTQLPSLDEFYQLFAAEQARYTREVQAPGGLLFLTAPSPVIHGIRGLLQVPASTSLTLALSTGTAQGAFAVYVDGILVRSGTGDREFSLMLEGGARLLEILVVSRSVALQLPTGVPVLPVQDVLAAPVWTRITPGYADVQAGTSTVDLVWNSDVRAGGWIVLRRERRDLALVVHVTEAGRNGVFGVELNGDVASLVSPGSTLYSGSDIMGVVESSEYDAASTRTYNAVVYTGLTNVQLRLVQGRTETSTAWLGAMSSTGAFREVHRIQRSLPSPTVSWQDTGVALNTAYEYALQAYGLFDPATLSPWSQVLFVVAGDSTPPASIALHSTPAVLNRIVTVLFDTPVDDDYAGVRTLFSEVVQSGTVVSATATSVTLNATPASDPTGMYLEITGGTGAGQVMPVLSGAGAVMTTNTWDVTLNATSTYELRSYTEILTDYGIPNTADQFSFAVPMNGATPRYGRFHFVTFDLAGNEQAPSEGVLWTYDGSTDETLTENQPPVVGIRQLTSTEQETLQPDTINYAVVELSALDPVDGTTGVVIQYRGRTGETGTSTGANGVDTLWDTTKSWPNGTWLNYLVRISGGTGIGQERTISTNFGTHVVVTPNWTTVPDATSTYEIAWRTGLAASAGATALDNPTGTRRRLVQVARSGTDNWIQVRAVDQDGLYSDVLAYTPDFDAIPEFSSVELTVDPLQDRVIVVGAVDDDTRSVSWWLDPAEAGEPSAGSPSMTAGLADLTQLKSFRFEFPLADGKRKTLYLRPFTGTNGGGLEGTDFEKEISRPPRTTVTFDNRTEGGSLSATFVRASFQSRPPITDATTSAFADSGLARSLRDNDAGWTPDVWKEDRTQYQVYYVRLVAGEGAGQIRKIVSNTTDTLTVDTNWTVVPTASTKYVIQRGATLYRILTSAVDNSPFLATGCQLEDGSVPPVPIQRLETDQFLEYYTELNDCPQEEPHRVRIDPDEKAEVYDMTVLADGNEIVVTLGEYDDDILRWQLYAKKGSWPLQSSDALADPLSSGQPVDRDFQRCDLLIRTAEQLRFHVSAGTWHLILVPFNGYHEEGQRLTAQVAVTGTATTTGILSLLAAAPWDNGAAVYNRISWQHNAVLNNPQTTYTVRVYGYRTDLGSQTEVELTNGLTRYPWQDTGTGFDNTDDIDELAISGSFLHAIPFVARSASGITRTWQYRVDLCQGGTVLSSYNVPPVTDAFLSTAPSISTPATAVVSNSGTCSNLV